MADRRLLICDTDQAYVEALTAFLMHALKGFSITTCTREGGLAGGEAYHISLMGEDFLPLAKDPAAGGRFGTVLYLCAQMSDENGEGYPSVFKFQQMGTFVKTILSYAGMHAEGQSSAGRPVKRWTGIHSPVRHELQLPFALAYGKLAARQERVLFLDMETNSILEDLIECSASRSLIDALYLSEESECADIAGLTDYYEGMSYFAPMRNFGEAAEVSAEQWERLFAAVDRSDYDRIVALFDDGLQCLGALFERLSDLVVVDKPGDFYRKSDAKLLRRLDALSDAPTVKNVTLPMSGNNLADGTYRFEQLLQGNLGRFVESEFA